MNQDRAFGMIWLLGALVLVGSALVARRLPAGHMIRLAMIWVAIIAGVALLLHLVMPA